MTSLQIFRSYITRSPVDGSVDVSQVFSRECYLEWLHAKNATECDAEAMKFSRILSNHVSGVDGRTPFDPLEEAAFLVIFRKRLPWPCFPPHLSKVNARYRSRGYHEKLAEQQRNSTGSSDEDDGRVPFTKPPLPQTAFMSFAPVQQDLRQDSVNDIIRQLNAEEATYVSNLGQNVGESYGNVAYSIEVWKSVLELLRFVVYAKTSKCTTKTLDCGSLRAVAMNLCTTAAAFDSQQIVSMVTDLTAPSLADRILVQNPLCLAEFGHLVGNQTETIVDGSELVRVVIAVAAAIHRPGVPFRLMQQRTRCARGEIKQFDLYYMIDPMSFLLVIYGKKCAY